MDELKNSWSERPYNEYLTEKQAWYPVIGSFVIAALFIVSAATLAPKDQPQATITQDLDIK